MLTKDIDEILENPTLEGVDQLINWLAHKTYGFWANYDDEHCRWKAEINITVSSCDSCHTSKSKYFSGESYDSLSDAILELVRDYQKRK
jgi:hypothetical protein